MSAEVSEWMREVADRIYRETQGVIARGIIEQIIAEEHARHCPSAQTAKQTEIVRNEIMDYLGLVPQMASFDGRDKALSPETIAGLDEIIARHCPSVPPTEQDAKFWKDRLVAECVLGRAKDRQISALEAKLAESALASAAPPPCTHLHISGHEQESWCEDCGQRWPNNLFKGRTVTARTFQSTPPQEEGK